MLFVDLGLAFRVAGEVLGRDLLLRRPLLVKLAAHLKHARYLRAIHPFITLAATKLCIVQPKSALKNLPEYRGAELFVPKFSVGLARARSVCLSVVGMLRRQICSAAVQTCNRNAGCLWQKKPSTKVGPFSLQVRHVTRCANIHGGS